MCNIFNTRFRIFKNLRTCDIFIRFWNTVEWNFIGTYVGVENILDLVQNHALVTINQILYIIILSLTSANIKSDLS
jgi:hypothetical protein